MQDEITSVKVIIEPLRETELGLVNMGNQEVQLKVEYEKTQAKLANLPPESLSLMGADEKPFDRTTSRQVSARDDILTKLDLLPGIRVRYEAKAKGQKRQLRIAAKALQNRCIEEARLKAQKHQAEATEFLSKYFGGDTDRARVAAQRAMMPSDVLYLSGKPTDGCEAKRWESVFTHYDYSSDIIQDAEALICLAEAFNRDEPAD
ncbi:MAG: hypothetical protein NT154_01390 [Verrucomicrobia bacterium]|nr:hypothetical protein [Verrucomicrobiota bacterium]